MVYSVHPDYTTIVSVYNADYVKVSMLIQWECYEVNVIRPPLRDRRELCNALACREYVVEVLFPRRGLGGGRPSPRGVAGGTAPCNGKLCE